MFSVGVPGLFTSVVVVNIGEKVLKCLNEKYASIKTSYFCEYTFTVYVKIVKIFKIASIKQ